MRSCIKRKSKTNPQTSLLGGGLLLGEASEMDFLSGKPRSECAGIAAEMLAKTTRSAEHTVACSALGTVRLIAVILLLFQPAYSCGNSEGAECHSTYSD